MAEVDVQLGISKIAQSFVSLKGFLNEVLEWSDNELAKIDEETINNLKVDCSTVQYNLDLIVANVAKLQRSKTNIATSHLIIPMKQRTISTSHMQSSGQDNSEEEIEEDDQEDDLIEDVSDSENRFASFHHTESLSEWDNIFRELRPFKSDDTKTQTGTDKYSKMNDLANNFFAAATTFSKMITCRRLEIPFGVYGPQTWQKLSISLQRSNARMILSRLAPKKIY